MRQESVGRSRRDADLVTSVLSEYGSLTRTAMQRYLPTGSPANYLYDLLPDYPSRGGKMMRSSICIATARAFGADETLALNTAVAIELLHNALLVHDDIQDGSEQRRGRPALHVIHGVPLAMNAGNTLALLCMRPLRDNVHLIGSHLTERIFDETERVAWESAEGQALELGWRHENRNDVSDEEYLLMVMKKTCWLAAIHPCRTGALIGTQGSIDVEPFMRFGFFLGAAFQVQDDALNLLGGRGYGKERNGDLFEGKRTLALNHLFRHASTLERQRLNAILAPSREGRSVKDVIWMRKLMDRYGSVHYALGVAHGLAGSALHEFDQVYKKAPASRDKAFIKALVVWVLSRTK